MEDLGWQTSNFIHIQNTETGIKNKISKDTNRKIRTIFFIDYCV